MFALVIIVNVFVLHLSFFFYLVNLLIVTHPSVVRHRHYSPPQTYGWSFHLAQRPFDKWITFHIAYKINQPTGYRKER